MCPCCLRSTKKTYTRTRVTIKVGVLQVLPQPPRSPHRIHEVSHFQPQVKDTAPDQFMASFRCVRRRRPLLAEHTEVIFQERYSQALAEMLVILFNLLNISETQTKINSHTQTAQRFPESVRYCRPELIVAGWRVCDLSLISVPGWGWTKRRHWSGSAAETDWRSTTVCPIADLRN